jgi:hypothetical protein
MVLRLAGHAIVNTLSSSLGKKSTFRVCTAVEAALVLKNMVAVPFCPRG